MFAFFNDLHIDLNVAIERRENFDATDRETISVQDIDFFDVAIDEKSDREVTSDATTDFDDEKNDTLSERSRTISDVNIERDKSFDDEKNEKIIDSKTDKTSEVEDETTNSTDC
ncbi:hypothetical protein G7Y79_00010g028870 [Physcia stellaris]|nr:hypothetical protein G7Y79_00010g028870 [Physcia stellaris]